MRDIRSSFAVLPLLQDFNCHGIVIILPLLTLIDIPDEILLLFVSFEVAPAGLLPLAPLSSIRPDFFHVFLANRQVMLEILMVSRAMAIGARVLARPVDSFVAILAASQTIA